jgi:hypothetical protein
MSIVRVRLVSAAATTGFESAGAGVAVLPVREVSRVVASDPHVQLSGNPRNDAERRRMEIVLDATEQAAGRPDCEQRSGDPRSGLGSCLRDQPDRDSTT